MIKNYLTVAWRNLARNKFFSAINILGLALGMTCSILIFLWVQNELSMDSFHVNKDRLFIVYERQFYDHKVHGQYATPGILADELKKDIPDIQYASETALGDESTFRVGEKVLKIPGGFASEDCFKMFSFPLIQGSAKTALNDPSSIAISRKMAEEFFGSPEAAIGKSIRYENRLNFNITAVFENAPKNASDKFDYLINWYQFLKDNPWAKTWDSNSPQTFIMLKPNADAKAVDRKLTHFVDVFIKPSKAFKEELSIQRLDETYLNSDLTDGRPSGGRIQYVQLFSIVAVFILLIACINFMNLTTARSVKRAREIGVRKVVGAVRPVLIRQFIGEAILLTFLAVLIAAFLVAVLLPVFNSVTQKEIEYPSKQISFWLWLAGLTLVTGFISGSYPALFLSGFNPVKVLKGTIKLSAGSAWFRKGLVVFQFSLSVILIVGTIVVSKQVSYIQSKNLGFDKENLIFVPVEGDLISKYQVFKDEALKMPGIKNITRITSRPTNFGASTSAVTWDGRDPNTNIEFTQVSVGYDFVKTMKLDLVEGRDFSKEFATDTNNYLINETGLKRTGYKDPIGKPFTMWGKKGKIVGILKDFHFHSLHLAIDPLVVRLRDSIDYGSIMIRTQPGQSKQAIATIGKLCKELNPNFTFTYQFSDLEFQKLYNNEQVISKLADAFAFLAIFISCLGLLGLAMFTAEQRTKEIGIRKVLGASVGSLFTLLSKEFIILVVIALLIASPIAWYAMNKWLLNYNYHINIAWWVFVLSGVIAIMITLATVSFQSLKAALMNPIKSLRSE
jgi:ABC-type antimicrobial peptide transport system permease subunit